MTPEIEQELRTTLRRQTAYAIKELADALGFPAVALSQLRQAQEALAKALAAAAALDPENV